MELDYSLQNKIFLEEILMKYTGVLELLTFFFRHALPLFTSLLNMVCSYDPVGYGVPYNHLMFTDSREQLVEGALQVLCVTMENESSNHNVSVDGTSGGTAMDAQSDVTCHGSFFPFSANTYQNLIQILSLNLYIDMYMYLCNFDFRLGVQTTYL